MLPHVVCVLETKGCHLLLQHAGTEILPTEMLKHNMSGHIRINPTLCTSLNRQLEC